MRDFALRWKWAKFAGDYLLEMLKLRSECPNGPLQIVKVVVEQFKKSPKFELTSGSHGSVELIS